MVTPEQIRNVTVDIVGGCNLSCPSCPVGNYLPGDFVGATRSKGMMSPEVFEKVAAKLKSELPSHVDQVHLYNWGDCLLHNQLPAILDICHSHGFKAVTSTNFSREVDLKPIVKALSNDDIFAVSLSGYTQEVYERGHRGGKIALVLSNLHRLRYEMDKQGKSFLVRITFHVYRDNFDDMVKISELCKQLKFTFDPWWANALSLEKWIKYIETGDLSDIDRETASRCLVSMDKKIEIGKQNRTPHCDVQRDFIMDHAANMEYCCGTYDEGIYGDRINYLDAPMDAIFQAKNNWSFCGTCVKNGMNGMVTEGARKALTKEHRKAVGKITKLRKIEHYLPEH